MPPAALPPGGPTANGSGNAAAVGSRSPARLRPFAPCSCVRLGPGLEDTAPPDRACFGCRNGNVARSVRQWQRTDRPAGRVVQVESGRRAGGFCPTSEVCDTRLSPWLLTTFCRHTEYREQIQG